MSFLFLFEHPLKSNLEISGCFFNFAGENLISCKPILYSEKND
nr:MAG TPA: hypothetical protein [Caudoviricetes sp.]